MQWNNAVIVRKSEGLHQAVASVAEAEALLLDDWQIFELESLGNALKACLLCNHDENSTRRARTAFETAARCSGILMQQSY